MDSKNDYWVLMQKGLEKQQGLSVAKKIKATEQQMRAEEFRRALHKFDAEQKKLNAESERCRKIEAKRRQEKRERDRRINEIRGLIAHYRRKLSFNKNDRVALAAISELETKLFWLMYGLK